MRSPQLPNSADRVPKSLMYIYRCIFSRRSMLAPPLLPLGQCCLWPLCVGGGPCAARFSDNGSTLPPGHSMMAGAVLQMTTVGQGQAPRRVAEMIVTIFTMVSGMLFNGVIVGTVGRAMMQASSRATTMYAGQRKVTAVGSLAGVRYQMTDDPRAIMHAPCMVINHACMAIRVRLSAAPAIATAPASLCPSTQHAHVWQRAWRSTPGLTTAVWHRAACIHHIACPGNALCACE